MRFSAEFRGLHVSAFSIRPLMRIPKSVSLVLAITPPRQQLLSEPSVDLWREIGEQGRMGLGRHARPVAVKAKIFGDCGAVSR
jgi:hypothetical protein